MEQVGIAVSDPFGFGAAAQAAAEQLDETKNIKWKRAFDEYIKMHTGFASSLAISERYCTGGTRREECQAVLTQVRANWQQALEAASPGSVGVESRKYTYATEGSVTDPRNGKRISAITYCITEPLDGKKHLFTDPVSGERGIATVTPILGLSANVQYGVVHYLRCQNNALRAQAERKNQWFGSGFYRHDGHRYLDHSIGERPRTAPGRPEPLDEAAEVAIVKRAMFDPDALYFGAVRVGIALEKKPDQILRTLYIPNSHVPFFELSTDVDGIEKEEAAFLRNIGMLRAALRGETFFQYKTGRDEGGYTRESLLEVFPEVTNKNVQQFAETLDYTTDAGNILKTMIMSIARYSLYPSLDAYLVKKTKAAAYMLGLIFPQDSLAAPADSYPQDAPSGKYTG